MKSFEVKNHEPSYLPSNHDWELVWSDEFDGPELDTSKWSFRLDFWGEKFDAYTDRGIVFDGNSNIELHRTERNGFYVSPQLQTGANSFDAPKPTANSNPWNHNSIWPIGEVKAPKFMHRFGYYECRCKFQKDPETMWSAFWTQSPSIGMTYDHIWSGIESDIMECFKDGECTTGNIMGGYGAQCHQEGRVNYKLNSTDDGFHRFGMLWTPEKYTFYCEGEKISEASEFVSQVPQFILLTTEIQGYRTDKPKAVGDKFIDDAFIVDYVRVFDIK